ncbi:MAG: DNA adenine methylase [Muribaculaceae bacterium]|nr:DNA adenine methylase [Muribaculaceae bacterium]
MKKYLSAPLPFVGQKRMFAREFIKVLNQYPDDTVFVDLFGGSGLLSHITKRHKPGATVIYNDFDNYRRRLENIPHTNALLAHIRGIIAEVDPNMPKGERLDDKTKKRIIECLRKEENITGYVDYITISSAIMFSMKYKLSLEELAKESFYNNVRQSDYSADDYLDGLIIESSDYRVLFDRYKDTPGVVFLVDPPYLSTDCSTYNMYWKLADYLDVLTILSGHDFIYFTSNKSSIIELCQWLGKNKNIGNPFQNCRCVTFNAQMNHQARYTDMMIFPLRA